MIANADPKANLAACAEEVRAAIARVLDSGRYILGPEVNAFEAEFATWLGAAHCVTVANGTDAIELALRAAGVRPGDGVVLPANTVSATIAGVLAAGGVPVFCDVDPATMNLSPAGLRELLGSPRAAGVRAIVPVHLYGQPCAMAELLALATERGLLVIEDCAQAHGAALGARKVGTLGHAAAFSFYPTKNLAALGDGGAVVTNDARVAADAQALRQYGWRERYVSTGEGGRNSRLDELQAAVLRVRLRHLDAENARRRELAAVYATELAETGLTLPPQPTAEVVPVFHQFVVRTAGRERLRLWLEARGIVAQALYPVSLHRQPAFARWAPSEPHALAECERCCAEVLSLPVHPALREAAVRGVAAAVRAWEQGGRA
ncbi:MAG TPA: DegT/DnrJ/EryC1/StrS family aminotransferase [Opitutaceae bacterium]|nr:DegT/DnrJ/EryC1/StrS family aminotransferase [Opitutaceae bacterium]